MPAYFWTLPPDEQLAMIRSRVVLRALHAADLPATGQLPADELRALFDHAQRVTLRYTRMYLGGAR